MRVARSSTIKSMPSLSPTPSFRHILRVFLLDACPDYLYTAATRRRGLLQDRNASLIIRANPL